MARLLVFWTRPQNLSAEEADAWANAELRRVLAAEGINTAQLTRLRGASSAYLAPWDWLLELDLPAGHDGRPSVDSAAWREWLGDLRLLRMHPMAMIADAGYAVTVEER